MLPRSVFAKTIYDRRHGLVWWSVGIGLLTISVLSVWPSVRDEYQTARAELSESAPRVLRYREGRSRQRGRLSPSRAVRPDAAADTDRVHDRGLLRRDRRGAGGGHPRVPPLPAGVAHASAPREVPRDLHLARDDHGVSSLWPSWCRPASSTSTSARRISSPPLFPRSCSPRCSARSPSWPAAVTRHRALAAGVASAAAVAAYLLSSLAALVEGLKTFRPISPFWWYSGHDPLQHGLEPLHVLLLVGATLVCVAAAVATFERRDLS